MAPDDLRLNMHSVLFVLTRGRYYFALATTYRLNIADFPYPISFCALVRGDTLWTYGFTVPETRVFQAADDEDLVVLACTVFDWSTRVTDGRTELRWLRRATAAAAVARKNRAQISMCLQLSCPQNSLYTAVVFLPWALTSSKPKPFSVQFMQIC